MNKKKRTTTYTFKIFAPTIASHMVSPAAFAECLILCKNWFLYGDRPQLCFATLSQCIFYPLTYLHIYICMHWVSCFLASYCAVLFICIRITVFLRGSCVCVFFCFVSNGYSFALFGARKSVVVLFLYIWSPRSNTQRIAMMFFVVFVFNSLINSYLYKCTWLQLTTQLQYGLLKLANVVTWCVGNCVVAIQFSRETVGSLILLNTKRITRVENEKFVDSTWKWLHMLKMFK